MKNIITFISLCILVVASCVKPYQTNYDFGFDREELRFAAKDTASYFMVYGAGEWSLNFSKDVAWVSLDKFTGGGEYSDKRQTTEEYGNCKRRKGHCEI